VQAAFGTVLWIVCGLAMVAAVLALISQSKTWDEYGKNHLLMDTDLVKGAIAGSAAALLERHTAIRQLLEARNARRVRHGEAPLDVERELTRLTAPAIDDGLRAEIRELVIARNHRRMRAGKSPLDVETEIARQIEGLSEVSMPGGGGGLARPR
jgi:hypothetical protein